jgi:protein-tyrosine phosphatase
MFRKVRLPESVPGRLLLHSMPGCFEELEQVWRQLRLKRVKAIVNLAQTGETRRKSPAYAEALRRGQVPCPLISFPVKDCGTPRNLEAYWELSFDLAQRLRAGENILIHCAAGVGRTGSLATCILIALGETPAAAAEAVWDAGSQPETDGQMELVAWCAARRDAGR